MRRILKWVALALLMLVMPGGIGGYVKLRSAGHAHLDGAISDWRVRATSSRSP